MTIVVYCSSQAGLEEKYQQLAHDLGTWIGQNGYTLLYGGSNAGLMHITAAAAHEAGGHVIGVIPEMFRHRIDPLCDEVVYTANLGDRKQYMIEHGDVFVVMPGGIGTLDEIFTVAASATIGYHQKPVILYNIKDYWSSLIQLLDDLQRHGMVRGEWRQYIKMASSIEELAALLGE